MAPAKREPHRRVRRRDRPRGQAGHDGGRHRGRLRLPDRRHGLTLDWGAIEGFSLDLVGQNGLGAVYAGPDYAAKTWAEMNRFTDTGGEAVLLRPATEMKCAGAPLKYAFLIEDYAARKGNRENVSITYAAHNKALFGVPIVSEKVRMLYQERGIDVVHERVLKAIDPARRVLTFETPEGMEDRPYDFTNVIPPMRAPEVIRQLAPALGRQVGRPGLGRGRPADAAPRPLPRGLRGGRCRGRAQGQDGGEREMAGAGDRGPSRREIAGREGTEVYNGYTSCPLITRVGRAMLIEFDYKDNLVPSFPGMIAPLEELWISWLMKEVALKPTYNAMLRGKA
jgi:sulfide:quinone oxidoreductase